MLTWLTTSSERANASGMGAEGFASGFVVCDLLLACRDKEAEVVIAICCGVAVSWWSFSLLLFGFIC